MKFDPLNPYICPVWRRAMIWLLQGPYSIGDCIFESQLWLLAKNEGMSKDDFRLLYSDILERSKTRNFK